MKSEKHIPDWNKDGVWDKVEDQLHQKKKRRFLLWWSIGTISAIAIFGLFILFNSTGFNSTGSSNIAVNENQHLKAELEESTTKTQSNAPVEKAIAIDNDSTQEPLTKTTAVKLNTVVKNNLDKNKSTATGSAIQNEKVVKSTRNFKIERKTAGVDIPENKSIENIALKSASHQEINIFHSLAVLPIDLSSIHFNRNDSTPPENLKFSVQQNHIKEIVSTYWWAESGLSVGERSFSPLTENNGARNSTEQFRFIHTNAIGIQKFLNAKWSLKLGLAYQTIYEKYEGLSSSTEVEPIFSDAATVYNLPNGVVYYESGTTTIETTSTRNIIHNNFTHRLSIPVGIAYAVNKNSWSVEPAFGFRFQYFQKFNGVIMQDGEHVFDLIETNDSYYSKNLSMGLIASLNLKYHVFQNGTLGMKLSYEKDDFLNLNKNDSSFRYETIGLTLGYYHTL